MKFAAWVMCWPLLGLLWVCATIGDSMGGACEKLEDALEALEGFWDCQ
jgi:hypothetical protein